MTDNRRILDDVANTVGDWALVSDQVMGGVSDGKLSHEALQGRMALRLTGHVSTENNGGFLQMARNLGEAGGMDASGYRGLELKVLGNGETYNIHLRTKDVTRPWQSYRHSFAAPDTWTTIKLPFGDFEPHRITSPLDLKSLRRIGIVAIGKAFNADVALSGLHLYR
ncbi:CIA30 family protein [Roseovarius sp. A21]|uniref:CIA30 family protein n=1 Tax=Roseovarius bejariae TaxID=2576383 RepID=A0A844D3G7_9RHOB|nr:CIA30 family protein [Roseovarius bejariae]MRU16754.1 CIA30 family protein [Roseovarius bejariae]